MPFSTQLWPRQGGTFSLGALILGASFVIFSASSHAFNGMNYLNTDWLAATSEQGIEVHDTKHNVRANYPGNYEQIDSRNISISKKVRSPHYLVAATNKANNSLDVFTFINRSLQRILVLPIEDAAVDGVCLYKDHQRDVVYAFILKSQRSVEQWLIYDLATHSSKREQIRTLPVSANASSCSVSDHDHKLYIAEENIGVWQFAAQPEAELTRKPVTMLKPFGSLQGKIKDIQIVEQRFLFISQPDQALIQWLDLHSPGENKQSIQLAQKGIESFTGIRTDETHLQLAYFDSDIQTQAVNLPVVTIEENKARFPFVLPSAETKAVKRYGDAANDPAIWVSPRVPEESLIFATDKQNGLAIYNLKGEQVQFLESGRLNNVGIRHGFIYENKDFSVAAATQRDKNAIALFGIHDRKRWVVELPVVPTTLNHIYGLCMYKDEPNKAYYVFVNDEDGRYQQYQLHNKNDDVTSELVREFTVEDQPKGCVVDERTHTLYIGVEDHGIWKTSARPVDAPIEKIIGLDNNLHADVEGMALYQKNERNYLIVSSQGNNSFAIYNATSPYNYIGSFEVKADNNQAIDGVSETSGLDITSANLGEGYSEGLLVVQDGRNVMPTEPQNFKLIPFDRIINALNL